MLRQLLTPGYFSIIENDAITYTNWAWQFDEALREGIIYPRWLPLNFWGYGSPIFILYPPLAFYLTSFFNLFTDSIISAMNITKFTALFLSITGMFYLAREYYSEKVAFFTALFYLLCPYTIFQNYLVGTFASNISLLWFAPILVGIHRYSLTHQIKYVFLAGISFGGLIVTHLVNAYMFSFIVVLYVFYLSFIRRLPRAVFAIPAILSIGLLIASAYILPIIFEKQYLSLKSFIAEGGGFHYGIFFILPDFSDKLPSDNFWHVYHSTYAFFSMFFFTFLFASILRIVHIRHQTDRPAKENTLFFVIVGMLSLCCLFGISSFVWEGIPFFKYIQFPVRWLNITNFSVSFLSSILFFAVSKNTRSRIFTTVFLTLIFFTFLALDYKYVKYAHIFPQEELFPIKIVNSNVEHLPMWAVKQNIAKDDSKNDIAIIHGYGEAEVVEKKSAEIHFKINGAEQLTVKVRIFYFPGWKAFIDGAETVLKIDHESGAMVIDVPRGQHTLELKFVDTPVRRYGKLISLFSIFSIVILFIANKR